MVRPIPEGYHTITPHITVRSADRAIEFYKKAFGAEVLSRMLTPDGRNVLHAEIKIGSSIVMLADEMPGGVCRSPQTLNGTGVMMNVYVEDVDASFRRAVDAGAKVLMPVQDMFWGDRYGQLMDPFGHAWSLATRKEDVPAEEMDRRTREFFAKAAKAG